VPLVVGFWQLRSADWLMLFMVGAVADAGCAAVAGATVDAC